MFSNLYDLLDAAMLFGGEIRKVRGIVAGARIVFHRPRHNAERLAWMIGLLYHHNIDLNIGQSPDQSIIQLETDPSPFYGPAADRWYGSARLPTVPDDLELADALLAAWLMGNLAYAGQTIIASPRVRVATAERLAREAAKRIGRCDLNRRGKFGSIKVCDRNRMLRWLEKFTPLQLVTVKDREPAITSDAQLADPGH